MPRGQRKEEILRAELPPTLPLMALRSTIVYPLGTIAVQMGAPENLALLRAHEESGLVVALVVASGDGDDAIDPHNFIGRVGVAARVHERINLPGDTVQITLQGLRSITIDAIDQVNPFAIAQIQGAKETPADAMELDELVARTVAAAETLAELVDRIPNEVPQILKMNVSDPGRFADLAATNMNLRISDKEEVLQRLDIGHRIRFILSRLEREVARARVMEDVKKQTEVKIEQHQREFYLRQQLRAIQSELGEADPNEKESVDMLRRIEEARLPEKVATEARRETERMRMLSPASSEYHVLRTYLDWVLALPWHKRSADDQEIVLAKVEDALGATVSTRPRSASSSISPCANCAAAIRPGQSCVLWDRPVPGRHHLARRSPIRSAASSIASRWVVCVTKPRSADTGARTWAPCRACSFKRCAVWKYATR